MLNLSYKETEALFRLLHDVPEAKTRALFARFKAFQQLDFPHREGVGRGSRVGYTFDQMLQLVSAFELLEAGAMPQRAARASSESGGEIAGRQRSERFEGPVSGEIEADRVRFAFTGHHEAAMISYRFEGSVGAGGMAGTVLLGAASDHSQGIVNRTQFGAGSWDARRLD